MAFKVTPVHQDLINYVQRYRDENGVGPTLHEMREELTSTAQSVEVVRRLVRELVEAGVLQRNNRMHRSLRVIK